MSERDALTWIADTLNETPARVHVNARRLDLPAWDSLGQLLLLAALDQEFGIKLTQREVAALDCVRSILDVLERNARLIAR